MQTTPCIIFRIKVVYKNELCLTTSKRLAVGKKIIPEIDKFSAIYHAMLHKFCVYVKSGKNNKEYLLEEVITRPQKLDFDTPNFR